MSKEENKILEAEIRRKCWVRDSYGKYGDDVEIPYNGILEKHEIYKFCNFYQIFIPEEKKEFLELVNLHTYLFVQLDWVHILGRGKNKYDLEKTCLGNRLAHSLFDKHTSPANGGRMTRAQRENWQERLLENVKSKGEIE